MGTRHRAIRVEGIPHWITPGDVKRMAERSGASGIIDGVFVVPRLLKRRSDGCAFGLYSYVVFLDNVDGIPSGKASIEFYSVSEAQRAATLLNNAQISAIPVRVVGFEHARNPTYSKKKRLTVEDIRTTPKAPATTVIFGLPKDFLVKDVDKFLYNYRLNLFGSPEEALVQLYSYV
ncbi:12835_t:CDS:1 [Acaulospora colombiana]|uniref:12835_t:CDS:1 n=1 Tax=Acaulospora colombiana TaxID=27376 RepID=A0ACA9LVI0_9GLOM|nr:12835_t:CDS:1 [Acaulospora colombiana]